jgi:hypothetical protein
MARSLTAASSRRSLRSQPPEQTIAVGHLIPRLPIDTVPHREFRRERSFAFIVVFQEIRRSGCTAFRFSGFQHPDQILIPDIRERSCRACFAKGSALAAGKSGRPVSPTFRADACCALFTVVPSACEGRAIPLRPSALALSGCGTPFSVLVDLAVKYERIRNRREVVMPLRLDEMGMPVQFEAAIDLFAHESSFSGFMTAPGTPRLCQRCWKVARNSQPSFPSSPCAGRRRSCADRPRPLRR